MEMWEVRRAWRAWRGLPGPARAALIMLAVFVLRLVAVAVWPASRFGVSLAVLIIHTSCLAVLLPAIHRALRERREARALAVLDAAGRSPWGEALARAEVELTRARADAALGEMAAAASARHRIGLAAPDVAVALVRLAEAGRMASRVRLETSGAIHVAGGSTYAAHVAHGRSVSPPRPPQEPEPAGHGCRRMGPLGSLGCERYEWAEVTTMESTRRAYIITGELSRSTPLD